MLEEDVASLDLDPVPPPSPPIKVEPLEEELTSTALVLDGVVQNIIVSDSTSSFVEDNPDYFSKFTLVTVSKDVGSPGVGWTYDGKSFSEPVEEDDTTTSIDYDIIQPVSPNGNIFVANSSLSMTLTGSSNSINPSYIVAKNGDVSVILPQGGTFTVTSGTVATLVYIEGFVKIN